MLRVVADVQTSAELGSSLDEIVREGARRMLAAELEAEVDAYVSGLVDEVDEAGKRWWSATAMRSPGASRPAPVRSRSSRRG